MPERDTTTRPVVQLLHSAKCLCLSCGNRNEYSQLNASELVRHEDMTQYGMLSVFVFFGNNCIGMIFFAKQSLPAKR